MRKVWNSDQQRPLKVVALTILLVGFCALYGWRATQRPVGWSKCLAAPEASDGERVVLSLYTVDGVDELGLLRVSKVARDVPVELTQLANAVPPEPGQRVSVVGHFRASDQVLVAETLEVHLLRWVKEALGMVGLLIVAIGLPFCFRWRNGRLEERWRIW